jgi:hypothetical protein
MPYSEAVEVLLAAKPLIDRLKSTPPGYNASQIEWEALENIEQVLKEFADNQHLSNAAGWTFFDLLILRQRLDFYRSVLQAQTRPRKLKTSEQLYL